MIFGSIGIGIIACGPTYTVNPNEESGSQVAPITMAQLDTAIVDLAALPEYAGVFNELAKLYQPIVDYTLTLPESDREAYFNYIVGKMSDQQFIDSLGADTAAFASFMHARSFHNIAKIANSLAVNASAVIASPAYEVVNGPTGSLQPDYSPLATDEVLEAIPMLDDPGGNPQFAIDECKRSCNSEFKWCMGMGAGSYLVTLGVILAGEIASGGIATPIAVVSIFGAAGRFASSGAQCQKTQGYCLKACR